MTISKTNPAFATIRERYRLTGASSSKETHHVVLDLKGTALQFKPGDSIGIFAQNDPALVDQLLAALKAQGSEKILDPRTQELISMRDFLTSRANLFRLNSSLLKFSSKLTRLLEKEHKSELMAYLSAHDPLDFLREHPALLPLQELCAHFSPLLPRFYSVASSLMTHQNEVHLTVALTTFMHRDQIRYGVASHFLCHLAEVNKTSIPIYVQSAPHFTLPEKGDAPMIMIGPGTGVAPFRAFMQERMHLAHPGKNWLFFGERNRQTDYFYQEFWNELVSQNKLRLDLAFSRDQAEKIYVHHRLSENAADIWSWISDGAHIYVCGDADKMAKDVDASFHRIAEQQGNLSPEQARAFMKNLRSQKRYLFDVY